MNKIFQNLAKSKVAAVLVAPAAGGFALSAGASGTATDSTQAVLGDWR